MIKGVSVTPGLACGPVHVVRAAPDEVPTWYVPGSMVEHEVGRLHRALERADRDFQRRQEIVAEEATPRDAEIFAVHRMVLQDQGERLKVEERVRDGVNAEAALQAYIERLEQSLDKRLRGGLARSYAADITDPWRGVLDCLMHDAQQEVLAHGEEVILAAAELTPQVVTLIERSHLLAVICEKGGRFSHGAVLARALGVPCVVSLPNLLARLEQGMTVIVDGERGVVKLRPLPADIEQFQGRHRLMIERQTALARDAGEPAVTPDGRHLQMLVNIESLRDFDTFDPAHVEGVGLLRTEFLYMERPQFPSEEEQYRLYRRAFEHMEGRPVTLRVLDIGADKQLPYFKTPEEPNPALGWRGLRILLDWQDLFRVQLRAMLRAGVGRDLRILLPMVASMNDIAQTRAIFDRVRASLLEEGYEVEADVPVGVMIEVPSVLFILPEVLKTVDFISVGTNDLVQYLLAVDRDNPRVARFYAPQHPSVIQALDRVARRSREAGVPCSVCGDMAGDPLVALLMLGLGYDSISVAPKLVPEIKYAVRRTPAEVACELARQALAQPNTEGVQAVLEEARERLLGTL